MSTPFCDCGKKHASGYTRDPKTPKESWLCANCLRPARLIFDCTDRWADERLAYYGTSARHDRDPVRHVGESGRDRPLVDAVVRTRVECSDGFSASLGQARVGTDVEENSTQRSAIPAADVHSEKWLAVVGWEDRYAVSDLGNVYSFLTNQQLKLSISGTNGRPRVNLTSFDGSAKTKEVHTLVAQAFLGPCPDGQEVLHGDGVRTNNSLSNLRYGTRSENNLDAVAHGTHYQAKKTHCLKDHELTDDNLVPSSLKKGRRDCLTCSRDRAREAHRIKSEVPMSGPLVFDIESHSAKEMYAYPRAKFFRIGAVQGLTTTDDPVSTDDVRQFRDWLGKAPVIIGHNIFAFDLPALGPDNLLKQARAREVIDTWTLATVLDPPPDSYQPKEGARRFPTKPEQYKSYYALDNLAFQYGVEGKSHSLKDLAETYGDPNACCTFGTIPTDNAEYNWYLKQDVSATRVVLGELFRRFSPQGMTDYLWREMRVAAVMSQVSQNGFRLDQNLTRARIDSNNQIRERNTAMLVERYNLPLTNAAGKPSKSPTATKEGKQAIFAALADCGVSPHELPKTKGMQPSLGSEGLIALAAARPDNLKLQWVVETLAGIQGLRTVYQTALDNVHSDGFCHPDVFMLQASGRASFQDPGLTVFGKRGGRHIEREIFLPDNDEHVLFSADFSQIDARAVAAHSQDHNYLNMFAPGIDIHMQNAIAAFGAEAVAANPKLREVAKIVGHGWNYNMGFDKLAALPGVGDHRARAFLDAQDRQFPRLIQWKAEMVDLAGRTGRLDNGFGRLMKANRQRAFTQGPALMGQGAARDLAMEAVLRMDDEVVRMLKAFIHDELIFSVPIKRAIEIRQHVIDCMTFEWAPPGASRPVQIIADATKFGLNWGSLYA